jgi:hypothetical protein
MTAGGVFGTDRWQGFEDSDGTMTMQQSTVAPAGHTNSLLLTTGTADSSLTGSQGAVILQSIEGFNTADLAWGTASAQAITLSFWVRSSLTGTFGGSLRNSGSSRSYVFSYSISAANTWEYKSITISGDTSGTWLADNGQGINVTFSLGAGPTISGTAGSWSSSNLASANGATSVIGTNGATFYITGVQLEPGSVATPFERRSYGQELSLCQRYYEQVNAWWVSDVQNTSTYGTAFVFAVEKRATPTMASISQGGAANGSMNTRTPSAFSSRKGGATTATASTTIVSAGFNDVYSASAEL